MDASSDPAVVETVGQGTHGSNTTTAVSTAAAKLEPCHTVTSRPTRVRRHPARFLETVQACSASCCSLSSKKVAFIRSVVNMPRSRILRRERENSGSGPIRRRPGTNYTEPTVAFPQQACPDCTDGHEFTTRSSYTQHLRRYGLYWNRRGWYGSVGRPTNRGPRDEASPQAPSAAGTLAPAEASPPRAAASGALAPRAVHPAVSAPRSVLLETSVPRAVLPGCGGNSTAAHHCRTFGDAGSDLR